jgi:hypothetical protein
VTVLRQLLAQLVESLQVLPFTQVAQSVTLALYESSLLDLLSQSFSQLSTSTFVGLHMFACSQTMLQLLWAGSRLGPAADEQASDENAMEAAAKKSGKMRFIERGSSPGNGPSPKQAACRALVCASRAAGSRVRARAGGPLLPR